MGCWWLCNESCVCSNFHVESGSFAHSFMTAGILLVIGAGLTFLLAAHPKKKCIVTSEKKVNAINNNRIQLKT